MTSLLENTLSASVIVVGDIMLDRYWRGLATRMSPEAPVPIVRVVGDEPRVGGAANVAANAAALGATVSLIGITGDDADAHVLEALCHDHGLNTHFIRCPQIPTTVKLRVLAQHQQLIRMDFEATPPAALEGAVHAALLACLKDARVVVFSDYAKGALSNVSTLIASAKQADKIVIVDPKGTDFARYRGADLLTPNLSEFEAVVGKCEDDAAIVKGAEALCREHALGAVLVTRGEHGMTLVAASGRVTHLATRARDVFDVTGAGDTVCAALAWSLAEGIALERAVDFANTAAGIAVGKVGTAIVTAAEMHALTARPAVCAGAEVLTLPELLEAVKTAKHKGLRIVLTNGCFDVLHAGHVRYLEAAAALGERLVIAVNSDASVQRIKGSGRPVNGLAARVEVLSRLRGVDWIVTFDTDTPQQLIAAVLPDVLVKGGDYDVTTIAGAAEVIAAGGRVLALPFHAGFSSTGIIDKLARPKEDAL